MSLECLLSFKIQKTKGVVCFAKSNFIRLERLAKCTFCKPYQVQKERKVCFHTLLSSIEYCPA
nr:MAG TPA: hypothetical protein [Crassvirales sp.]DAU16053.1 MAG TPA: hypothetical protein [Caudoviricetes sp.]